MSDLKQRVEDALNGKLHFQEMGDLIADLYSREVKLILNLKNTEQALNEIDHAHRNPNWFTHGSKAADAHLRMWIHKGKDGIRTTLSELGITPEGER